MVSGLCGQEFQQVVGCAGLAEAWKDLLDAVEVRVGAHVGHRIYDERYVVAEIVGAARREFPPLLVATPVKRTWVAPR